MAKTVLLVDDEALVLRALKRELSTKYDLSVAYSAAEADELLRGQRHFDVVVTDISMPQGNGLDFIESVAPRNPFTRFIVLSGVCDAEVYQRAKEMTWISRLLTKPSSGEEIVLAIEEAAAERFVAI